jgi:tetrahydromethanopterin S-methyltransferase subunit A
MSHIYAKLMDEEDFETIRKLIEDCPDTGPMHWEIKPRVLTIRYKKPQEDKSKDLDWATNLANVTRQSGLIIGTLWAHILHMREQAKGGE